jgi:CheY-like chemotaxis protein
MVEIVHKENLRLVVVENDDNDLFFLQRALRKKGFTCPLIRLTDGQDAIEYFSHLHAEECPHVVLLDLNMPRKDGFDVLQWLRQNPSYGSMPVIILSSSDEPSDIIKAQTLQATKFLQKKNLYREVIESLESFLETTPDA